MQSKCFSSLPRPVPDPLFAIAAEAERAGPEAINGTLGVFMDEDGKPLVFSSVLRTLEFLGRNLPSFNYSYPVLTGLPKFRQAVLSLISSGDSEIVASIASTGGTGALAINLRLMKMLLGNSHHSIIVPVPAWANHPPLCRWAGLQIITAPYLASGKTSIDAIVEMTKAQTQPFGILLQVGCHNPTGLDFTDIQWRELVSVLASQPCVLLLDFAYQGLKGEPEDDAGPVQLCTDAGLTTLVTWSASKNHSIYGLRTGLACAFVTTEQQKKTVEGTYCSIVRGLHSAAPTFGQAIVALVQQMHAIAWRDDLREARAIVQRKRKKMFDGLPPLCSTCLSGHGMFAMLPLTADQVNRLKIEYKVFLSLDGRVNIAGIPERRIDELCEKVRKVMEKNELTN